MTSKYEEHVDRRVKEIHQRMIQFKERKKQQR